MISQALVPWDLCLIREWRNGVAICFSTSHACGFQRNYDGNGRRIGATRLLLMVRTFLLNCEHFDVISMVNKSTYDRKLLSIVKCPLLTKRFVNMAGYWPSWALYFHGPSLIRGQQKRRWERGQCPASLSCSPVVTQRALRDDTKGD